MENSVLSPKPIKDNIINVRVEEQTFRVVLAVAHKYAGGSMSEVVRLCIQFGLQQVEELYKRKQKVNEEFKL